MGPTFEEKGGLGAWHVFLLCFIGAGWTWDISRLGLSVLHANISLCAPTEKIFCFFYGKSAMRGAFFFYGGVKEEENS